MVEWPPSAVVGTNACARYSPILKALFEAPLPHEPKAPTSNGISLRPHPPTALPIDPYIDFFSEGDKLWPLAKQVARDTNTIDNMIGVVMVARSMSGRIVFIPFHRWIPCDFDNWKLPTVTQLGSARARVCEKDSWGTFETMPSQYSMVTSSLPSTGHKGASPIPTLIDN
ncbi:hypothetical protein CDES_11420 [Corynebacterium deserti GIMN1.010]|uniref:Uncharacterized protein n=1 Tax=Corynebacterium deserti GIMN1.010 TaxID=931089 RepID=A0A0M4CYU1_9CORY|nr:hypothetical protein [Corynebacterium deserti]ALC06650.1 hypothetical protein CDES_11420 [Corynebacterium deserti GIMN1.010]